MVEANIDLESYQNDDPLNDITITELQLPELQENTQKGGWGRENNNPTALVRHGGVFLSQEALSPRSFQPFAPANDLSDLQEQLRKQQMLNKQMRQSALVQEAEWKMVYKSQGSKINRTSRLMDPREYLLGKNRKIQMILECSEKRREYHHNHQLSMSPKISPLEFVKSTSPLW